ncbi:MAG: hypothetical protein QXD43_02545 [Candidatus Aenigmatarchaeota archaeon]
MSYGNTHLKSTVFTKGDYSSISGEGYISSNNLETARRLASGLADSLDHNNEIAYEIHKRSKGWE